MALTPISNAIAAYSNVARGATGLDPMAVATNPANVAGGVAGVADPNASAGPPVTSFAALLQDATNVAIGSVKTAEQSSAAAIAGKADIREVVAAVTNAELTLETVVAVRDKVINAYNEILRMPI